MNKTIAITGANGFIGKALVEYFSTNGFAVKALQRNIPSNVPNNVSYYPYDLKERPSSIIFENVDYLIHCAYAPNTYEENIHGSKTLVESAEKAGVKKILFISSLSALENAISEYGKQKYELQNFFIAKNHTVIRPGLVIGNGGVFKKMEAFIKQNKIIPIINSGEQPIQIIFIDDLVFAIEKIIADNYSGLFTLATNHKMKLKNLYQYIAKKNKLNPIYIPLNWYVAYFLISILSLIGLRNLPVSKESLLGMKKLKHQNSNESLNALGLKLKEI